MKSYPYALSIDEETSCSDSTVKDVLDFLAEDAGKACDLNDIEVLYEKCTPVYVANQMRRAFTQVCEEK